MFIIIEVWIEFTANARLIAQKVEFLGCSFEKGCPSHRVEGHRPTYCTFRRVWETNASDKVTNDKIECKVAFTIGATRAAQHSEILTKINYELRSRYVEPTETGNGVAVNVDRET